MEFTGRITKDAVIKKTKDEREFVTFTVAINDYYQSKGSTERTQTVLYIGCAYWLSTKIAKGITKGAIVEITGRLYLNSYTSMSSEAKATLNCHVNTIKVHHCVKGVEQPVSTTNTASEDLPF